MIRRLFVGNLSYEVSASALRSLFASSGDVAEVLLATDADTGRPLGYAFVTMATHAAARDAITARDGELFEGRPLHVILDADTDAPLARAIRRALGYVRYARDEVGAAAVSLFLFDEDSGDLRGVVAEWDWTRTSFAARVSDWPTVHAALAEREIRVITPESASGPEAGWFEPRGISRSACVPLCDGERRLGVLFFDFDARSSKSDKSEAPERSDVVLLADVAERCARAIGRASK